MSCNTPNRPSKLVDGCVVAKTFIVGLAQRPSPRSTYTYTHTQTHTQYKRLVFYLIIKKALRITLVLYIIYTVVSFNDTSGGNTCIIYI